MYLYMLCLSTHSVIVVGITYVFVTDVYTVQGRTRTRRVDFGQEVNKNTTVSFSTKISCSHKLHGLICNMHICNRISAKTRRIKRIRELFKIAYFLLNVRDSEVVK